MQFKPNQPLWYAWLRIQPGVPVIAQIAEVFWLRPDKAPDTSRVQYPGNKFGLVANNSQLFDNPKDARAKLIAMLQTQSNDLAYRSKMCWNALSELDRTATVQWPALPKSATLVKVVAAVPQPAPIEPAIVNTLTPFKQNVAAQANANRRKARLVAHEQLAARKNPRSI